MREFFCGEQVPARARGLKWGVADLAMPEFLIEIEAVTVIEGEQNIQQKTLSELRFGSTSIFVDDVPAALELYRRGALQYDILVGPRVKSIGGHIAYAGAKDLVVYTSGRFFKGGWGEFLSYMKWRVGYYRRVGVFRSSRAIHD